jgi:hypothetical protein
MAVKTKSRKKNIDKKNEIPDQGQERDSRSKPTILGVTAERLGAVVASAVIGEVLQVAMRKSSQSDFSELKLSVQNQLDTLGDPVKSVVGAVKDAIADVASPAEAIETVKDTLREGQSTVVDTVSQGLSVAKETTDAAQHKAKDGADTLLDNTKDVADSIRQMVIDRTSHAVNGTKHTAETTRQTIEDTMGTVRGTSDATQQAIAAVVEDAVDQVQAILAGNIASDSLDNRKKSKKGKKNKKGKKGRK